MIPLRDENRSRKTPWVRNAFILLNIFVFLYSFSLGRLGLEAFFRKFGFTIDFFGEAPLRNSYSFISYQFLHGSLGHILGNMWYLWIFGDNVESRLGHIKFLFFYLFCGVLSAMVQLIFIPQGTIPLVGASGSIAGVLGAYASLFPKAKIVTWIPIGFGWFTKLPAWVFLVLWFFYQFLLAAASSSSMANLGGVAFWAHVGGFAVGLLYGLNIR